MLTKPRTQCEVLPPILTAIVVALAGVLALVFSWQMVVLYISMMPVPLTLLWASRTVPSPAERIALVDAQHAHG